MEDKRNSEPTSTSEDLSSFKDQTRSAERRGNPIRSRRAKRRNRQALVARQKANESPYLSNWGKTMTSAIQSSQIYEGTVPDSTVKVNRAKNKRARAARVAAGRRRKGK